MPMPMAMVYLLRRGGHGRWREDRIGRLVCRGRNMTKEENGEEGKTGSTGSAPIYLTM